MEVATPHELDVISHAVTVVILIWERADKFVVCSKGTQPEPNPNMMPTHQTFLKTEDPFHALQLMASKSKWMMSIERKGTRIGRPIA